MEFDYVIVGAGAAGCVLANRLSAHASNSVCLIEAGPPDTIRSIHVPFELAYLMRNKKYNWCLSTEPQSHLNGRRIYVPRGKTLGGSSSINGMIYVRGHRWDYDHWAELGNKGWGYDDLLPYFIKAEHFEPGGNSRYHGSDGPLTVSNLRSPNPFCQIFIRAGEELGIPHNPDFNGDRQEGFGLYHVTMKDGRRCSTAAGYLRNIAGRPNLTVVTDAHVTRITLSDRTATGVEFVKRGNKEIFCARREVLLSAGAINSAKLLMLSGIGSPSELRKHGIPVEHELPGVGQNLQDHFDIKIVQSAIRPVSYGLTFSTLFKLIRANIDYRRDGSGLLSSNGTEAGGFARSRPELEIPDLQFHFSLLKLDDHGLNLRFAIGHGYTLHIANLRPKSRGRVGLSDADPLSAPCIQPNYLAHGDDMEKMLEIVKIGRQLLGAKAFEPYRGKEILPGDEVQTDDEIRDFVRRKADTAYHPVGTCRMGQDEQSVVDANLKVHGLERLRVVDASIMPTIVGGNTLAPTVAIAEKGAAMILEECNRRENSMDALR